MTPGVLPQNDPEPTARASALAATRDEYRITHERVPGVAVLTSLPAAEAHTPEYVSRRWEAERDIDPNMQAIAPQDPLSPLGSLEAYQALFTVLPTPRVVSTWQTDASFAEQVLSGGNPLSLAQVTDVPDSWRIEDRHVSAVLGEGSTLASLRGSGTLYAVDHSQTLAGLGSGTHPGGKKFCPKPVALFVQSPEGLQPLAIQIDGPDSPVCTPAGDAGLWSLAKTCFQVADATVHEMSSHLARTHLVMAPFAIATARQLAETHPVGILLRPHFRFMLAINEHALTNLVNPGGPVDQLFGGSIDECLGVAVGATVQWSLDGSSFPADLAARGVANPDQLPHYPYRDDGLLLWEAIGAFVREFLAVYYPDDETLRADTELQAWAAEIASPEGGRIRGMPGQLKTRDELTAILTPVVFTCSVVHGAVNGTQYEYMAFAPNRPFSGYADYQAFFAKWNRTGSAPSSEVEAFRLQFLPPFGITCMQLAIMARLTFYHHDRLGHHDAFADPRAQAALEQFQKRLDAVEDTITARNRERTAPYEFLKPSQLLNSISI